MTLRSTLFVLTFVLLAACGPAKKDETAKPVAKGAVAVSVTPYSGGALKVAREGVGPITQATAFDLATLKALFPKAKAEQAFLHFGEGPPQPIINVEQGGAPLLEIGRADDGAIAYVAAASGDIRGPRDEQLLAKWADLGFAIDQCRPGQGREIHQIVCVRPEAATVSYVFGVPGWTGGGIPPEAMLKAKGQLNAFVWRPAERATVGAA